MAVSVYDNTLLSDAQKKQIQSLTDEWNRATAAGDTAGANAAHNAAEAVRASAGYSGGANGGGYTNVPSTQPAATRLPSYTPQTEQVNSVYDNARDLAVAQLKNAYDANMATLEAERGALPETYRAARNNAAITNELERQRFNEYAAANGLNTGARGQAALARSNTYQRNLSGIDAAEANANRDLNNQIAQLKMQYQNEVASAIANNEYERAQALLAEYQQAEANAISVAQTQAQLDRTVAQNNAAAAAPRYTYTAPAPSAQPARIVGGSNVYKTTDSGVKTAKAVLDSMLENNSTPTEIQNAINDLYAGGFIGTARKKDLEAAYLF